MNKKIITLSALAVSLSLSVPLAYAHHSQCVGGANIEKMVKALDLTPDQKTKIMAIRDQVKPQIQAKRQDMRTVHMQINDLYKADTLDESKLDELINQEKDTFGAILKIRANERRDIAAILTPEQKAKLADMMQKMEKKHQEPSFDHEGD